MSFNKQTKSLLLSIINEQSSMGGGVNLNPTLKDKKIKNKFEDEYYYGQEELKKSLKNITGKKPEEMTSDAPSLEYLAGLGMAKRAMGYSTDPNAAAELLTPVSPITSTGNWNLPGMLKQAAGLGVKTGMAAGALNIGMGELGQKLSTKLPYLAALGIDPFDYATKVMGVDYVADQLRKLPARQQKAIASGAGHIEL